MPKIVVIYVHKDFDSNKCNHGLTDRWQRSHVDILIPYICVPEPFSYCKIKNSAKIRRQISCFTLALGKEDGKDVITIML